MLRNLYIENIAVIQKADIDFSGGLTVLSGETGAGKSIIIDALSAILGGRVSRELIRTGAEKAFVSAAFSGMAPELTEELGIQPEADGTLLLQREEKFQNRLFRPAPKLPISSDVPDFFLPFFSSPFSVLHVLQIVNPVLFEQTADTGDGSVDGIIGKFTFPYCYDFPVF